MINTEMRILEIKESEICMTMNNIMNDGLLRINLAQGDKNAFNKWQQNNEANMNQFNKSLSELK